MPSPARSAWVSSARPRPDPRRRQEMTDSGIMRFFPLAFACFATCAQATYTPVNANGNGDGAERCLTGLTCGAGAYSGALSIVAAFERDLGLAPGSLRRIDDAADRRWIALSADAAIRPFARYAGDRSVLD